jgi:hypothetical protein
MKYATVKGIIASLPHPILPTVQGEPDYQTIHAIRKLLQAKTRATDTHLGGGALGHMGLIFSDASYAMIARATGAGPTLSESPTAPGRALIRQTERQLRSARRDTPGMKQSILIVLTLLFNKP